MDSLHFFVRLNILLHTYPTALLFSTKNSEKPSKLKNQVISEKCKPNKKNCLVCLPSDYEATNKKMESSKTSIFNGR